MKKEKFYIVRTYSAGVWFGNIKKKENATTFIMTNARMLYQWSGAAALAQLALEGVKNPSSCKFTMTFTDDEGVYLPQVITVLPCTDAAGENIKAVKEWKI